MKKITIKKPRVTEMLKKTLEERRQYKNKTGVNERAAHRKLNNELRRETLKVRKRQLKEDCYDIEEIQKRKGSMI